MSEKFCRFFADNVEQIFLKEAGIRPSFKIGLTMFKPFNNEPPHDIPEMYLTGKTSRIITAISILPEFQQPVIFCWKSKSSNQLVTPMDEDFDEADLECWMEGIDAPLFWKYINSTQEKHPFKLKDIYFPVEVLGFGVDMGLQIYLADQKLLPVITDQISKVIERNNNMSLKKDRKFGIIHNGYPITEAYGMNYRIDTGSAGPLVVNKILKAINKIEGITKLVIDL